MPRTGFRFVSVLALLLSGLGVPALMPSAIAKDAPCVVTTASDADFPLQDGILTIRHPIDSPITVPDAGLVRDIDVRIDIEHGSDGDLRAFLVHGDPSVGVGLINSPHPGVNFTGTTFDDEAAVALSAGVAPYTGRFRPDAPLSSFDGLVAEGTWTLRVVDDVPNAVPDGKLLGWSISVRYADCDFDGDGLKDEVDNCPDNFNAAQTNTDADLMGDACDPDDDNDTVPDTTDNCRIVDNLDQANNEGDALGDVCDSNDDNDPRSDANDACDFIYGKTVSGCPSAARSVTLSYSAGAFRGKLRAPGVQRCYAYRKVQIRKVDAGPDTRLSTRLTEIDGTYVWPRVRKPGTYYARAARTTIPNLAECARAESAKLTLR